MLAITRTADFSRPVIKGLEFISPVGDLLLRLWVANVFWKAGVNKAQSVDVTLQLFEYEYSVPLLSPTVAAYIGTGVELFFPVLLALGLGGRFAAGVRAVRTTDLPHDSDHPRRRPSRPGPQRDGHRAGAHRLAGTESAADKRDEAARFEDQVDADRRPGR